MTEEKWGPERVHKEVQEARTRLFVVWKVLETGNIDFAEHSEWAMVIKPLLKDIAGFTENIEKSVGEP